MYNDMYNDNDSYTKIIPSEIINGSIEFRQAFLEGLCDAYDVKDVDGYFHIDQKRCYDHNQQ
jgi:hypothetical protein